MQRGQSLIELMLVLAISAFLVASIGPPLREIYAIGFRSEARHHLYEQMQELLATAEEDVAARPTWLLPSGRYQIRLIQQPQTIVLQAEAIGSQQVDQNCLKFWLDSQGRRGSAPADDCWQGR